MDTKRIEWIDSARGFAMLSVVICHIANGFYRSQMLIQYEQILYSIQKICNSFQMPLFCIVSGFLFGKFYLSENNVVNKDKVRKQVINFALLYLIWSILFGIVKVFMGGSVNDIVKPIDILPIPVNPIGVYWWLYVLIFIYILVSVALEKRINKALLISFSFILYLVSSMLIKAEWTQWFEIRRIVYYFFIFLVGIGCQRIKDKMKYWPIVLLAFTLSIVLIVIFWNRNEELYHIPIINAVLAILLSLSIFWVFENSSILSRSRLLKLMGKHSLEIFLIHVFITAGSRFLIAKLPSEGAIVYLIIILTMTIFLPIIIGNLSKKVGVYNYLFCPYKVTEVHKKARPEV